MRSERLWQRPGTNLDRVSLRTVYKAGFTDRTSQNHEISQNVRQRQQNIISRWHVLGAALARLALRSRRLAFRSRRKCTSLRFARAGAIHTAAGAHAADASRGPDRGRGWSATLVQCKLMCYVEKPKKNWQTAYERDVDASLKHRVVYQHFARAGGCLQHGALHTRPRPHTCAIEPKDSPTAFRSQHLL